MDKNIKNVKFSVVDSLNPRYVEVVATFLMDGISSRHYIFITKRDSYKEKDYLNAAKEIFNRDVKNHKIKPLKKKASPLLIGLTSFFAVTTLALGGVLTYKLLVNPTDDPVVPTGDIKLVLDEESLKDVTLEPLTATKGEDYHGTLTVKESDKAIDLSHSIITANNQELMYNRDFTIKTKVNSNGNYQYALNINSDVMMGDVSLHMPTGELNDFELGSEVEYKNLLKDFSEELNLKTMFFNDYSSNLLNLTCNTYTKNLAKIYEEGAGQFADNIYVRLKPKEYAADTYTRGTETLVWKKGNARIQMYHYTPSKGEFPTYTSDLVFKRFNALLTNFKFSQFTYDKTTLSYVIHDAGVTTSFGVYQGKPTFFASESTSEDQLIGFSGRFFYNFKDIVVPDSSNSYVTGEETPYTDVSNEVWNSLLTLDDSENLVTNLKSRDEEITFFYNKDIYYETNFPKTIEEKYHIFRSKEKDGYYETSKYYEQSQWNRILIEPKQYEEYSYNKFKALLADVRDHRNDFTYNSESEWYVSDTYLPGKTFNVSFSKFVSRDGTNSEIIIDTLGCDSGGECYYDIATHYAAKLTLPIAK